MASKLLDQAQIRAKTALAQWLREVQSSSKRPDHIEGEISFRRAPIARNEKERADERKVEQYVRKLAEENAALLKTKTGKDTPIGEYIESCCADNEANESSVEEKAIERRSIYLYGSVGRGKSMLMDEMCEDLLSKGALVHRAHFSALMREVHRQMWQDRAKIETIGNSLADQYDFICIDEVVLADVQDAVIFPRLLTLLLQRGVAMILTANERPDRLYQEGINRHIYMPGMIEALRQGCRLVDLDWGQSGQDYRAQILGPRSRGRYLGDEREWENFWGQASYGEEFFWAVPGSETRGLVLKVKREETVKIRVEYEDVFKLEKVAEFDYVALAEWMKSAEATCFIGGRVLRFARKQVPSEARLFGKFVEVMYDAQVPVVICGETAEPGALFEEVDIHGRELQSAARRVISRLKEMKNTPAWEDARGIESTHINNSSRL